MAGVEAVVGGVGAVEEVENVARFVAESWLYVFGDIGEQGDGQGRDRGSILESF